MKYLFTFALLMMAMVSTARAQGQSPKTTTAADLKAKIAPTDSQKRKMDLIFKWQQVKADSLKKLYKGDQRELADMEKIEYAYLLSQIKSSLTEKQKEKFISLYDAKSGPLNFDPVTNIFPFPPPKGYTAYSFPDRFFKKSKHLQDVNQEIIKALTPAGYTDLSYYSVPGGFVIVTKTEKINPDGTSFSPADRFNLNSLNHMHVTGTLSSEAGYFRVFAFVVTNVPFSATDDNRVRPAIPRNWIGDGKDALPTAISGVAFGADYHCSVLVYEFQNSGANTRLTPVRPAKLSAEEHLRKSEIIQHLVP